ncbi:protein FLX-like 2 [Euphorbia lathyris]|uniref:protein FLX-like 2 n=1 Tax=Euphorbia lathyris TaxID=212925 RepID=UPI003313AE50
MGSKGRLPPHIRRPLPGHGMVHPDPFGPGVLPPPGSFPPFEMLPHPEILEQKLAAQHVEIQRLATENQRLAATHGTLRQELAAAQHELQMLHTHIGIIKSEREQQMRGLLDRIAKMENELKAAEPLRSELQQAREEADKLVVARQELMSKAHQLTQDLHRAHTDVQQIPVLMSELEGLRQEYQRCRVSYDYEKKLFSDHLESLQAMEKNYVTMSREVEKLRLELNNTTSTDIRAAASGAYGGATGNNESETSGRPIGQNMYEDGYQGHSAVPGNAGAAAAAANASVGAATGTGTPTYTGAQSGSAPAKPPNAPRGPGYEPTKAGYDAQRGHGYDAQRGSSYDLQRGPGYDPSRAPSYDAQRIPGYDPQRISGYDAQRLPAYDMQRPPGNDALRGPGYDAPRGPGYDPQRGHGYDPQRGPHYDMSRGAGYDGGSRGTGGPHSQMAPANNVPYGSATPPTRPVGGYEAAARGGTQARR